MFDVKIHTAPASELLSVANDVKPHLAITHSDDDTYLTNLVKQVREATERYCGISIGSQTRQWVYDFDDAEWNIPYGPVISISSIVRRTGMGTTETLTANTDYELQGVHNKTLTIPAGGRCTVTYVTGYTSLPEGLKRGMLEEIAYRYEHRGDTNEGLSQGAKDYLIRYKDFSWE